MRVWRGDCVDVWVLIHIEVQGQPEPEFSQRMFVYYYRIFDRYERHIMSVAVLGDEQADWRPAHFEQEFVGLCGGNDVPDRQAAGLARA